MLFMNHKRSVRKVAVTRKNWAQRMIKREDSMLNLDSTSTNNSTDALFPKKPIF